MDRPIACRRQAGQGSQSRKGAIAAPERHPIPTCQARLLGILDGRHQPGGSQPEISFPEETQGAPIVHPENLVAGTGEGISLSLQLGATAHTKELVTGMGCSDLGRAQNAGPIKSVPLWGTREPEPECLRPGKCMQTRSHSRQFPAEQGSLSSVDWESTHAMSRGKPSVVESL